MKIFRPLLFVVLANSACTKSDIVERHYDDYLSAIRNNELKKGWLPDYIPDSAADISILSNIDTNELRMKFETRDIGFLEHDCQRIDRKSAIFPLQAEASWWPRDLVEHGASETEEFTYFSCNDHEFVARKNPTTTIYFWRNGMRQ